MKYLLTYLLFSIIIIPSYSQVIKIENGVSFSSMKSDRLDLLNENLSSYYGAVGIDYLENKYFYLSSKIGYFKRGGKDKIMFDNEVEKSISENWDFVHINTTFRFKYPFQKSHIYIGIGPFFDHLIGSKKFETGGFESYSINKNIFGLCPEIGFNYELNKKFILGINFSYLLNISSFSEENYINIKNRTNYLSLSVGYNL